VKGEGIQSILWEQKFSQFDHEERPSAWNRLLSRSSAASWIHSRLAICCSTILSSPSFCCLEGNKQKETATTKEK
jgi:hypothetical protein